MTKNEGKHISTEKWVEDLDSKNVAGDEEIGNSRKERRSTKQDAVPSKTLKNKASTNQEKQIPKQESAQERRSRRLNERRERDAIETERRERERDFEKKRHASVSRYKPRKPPAGYRDPHEVCRPAVPGKVKDEKRRQMKALMNCIAYEPDAEVVAPTQRGRSAPRVEEFDNSLSSDTTSDMTDVTPRSSSSGCSSMSKQSVTPERADEGGREHPPRPQPSRRSKSEGRRQEEVKKMCDVNGNEAELEEMKYLQEAFEDFDLDEETSDFATSIISGLSEERRAKCGRRNMTFTNEQLREIERVNLILLKKIMAHKKPRNGSTGAAVPAVTHRKTSAAVNRARAEKNIEKENMVLLRKLQNVKATTGSIPRKATSPTAC